MTRGCSLSGSTLRRLPRRVMRIKPMYNACAGLHNINERITALSTDAIHPLAGEESASAMPPATPTTPDLMIKIQPTPSRTCVASSQFRDRKCRPPRTPSTGAVNACGAPNKATANRGSSTARLRSVRSGSFVNFACYAAHVSAAPVRRPPTPNQYRSKMLHRAACRDTATIRRASRDERR